MAYTITVAAGHEWASPNSQVLTLPSGTLTGKLLLIVSSTGTTTADRPSDPSGYTLLASTDPTDPLAIWGKVAGASESAPTLGDWTTNSKNMAFMVAIESPTGWPAIGSILAGSTQTATGTATGVKYAAHTVVATGNCLYRVGEKNGDTTGTTMTSVALTSGYTAGGFVAASFNTAGVIAGEMLTADTTLGSNATAVTAAITTWSGSANSHGYTLEFTPAAVITVSVDDDTPSPTQAIVITKSGGNWSGTPTATLTDNNGANVAMPALTSVSGAVATLTLGAGAITNYDDSNATWELIRWNQSLTLTVTDSSGSGTDTITITPPVLDHFDTLAGGAFDYAPSGSANGDDCYVHIVTGDGEGLPIIAGFQGNSVPTTVRFMVFDVSADKWLTAVSNTFDVASATAGDTYDTFTGANDTALNSHTPDADAVGDGWTIEADKPSNPAPTSGDVTIQSNRLSIVDNTVGGSIDLGVTDFDITWDYISGTSTSEEWTAYLRRVDGDNAVTVYVRRATNTVRVVSRVAGVGTALTNTLIAAVNTPVTIANSTTYEFRAVLSGSDFSLYVDNVLTGTYTIPVAAAATATRFGLYSSIATPSNPITFDNVNAITGYASPSNTITLVSDDVAPGGTVSGTLSSALAGTINAVYLKDVPLSITAATSSSFSATVMALAEFDANGTAVAIQMSVPQTLRVTDGTTELTTTMQVVYGVSANFGQAGTGPYQYPPAGLAAGDDVLVQVVSGSGTAYPTTAGFRAAALGASIIVRGFSVETGLWRVYQEFTVRAEVMALARPIVKNVVEGIT